MPNEVDFFWKQEMAGGGRSPLCVARQQELQKVLISGGFGQVVSFLLGK